MLNFFDNLIGWTLDNAVMQHWNRNQVYSSVTPTLMVSVASITLTLATLCWCQHHLVNTA